MFIRFSVKCYQKLFFYTIILFNITVLNLRFIQNETHHSSFKYLEKWNISTEHYLCRMQHNSNTNFPHLASNIMHFSKVVCTYQLHSLNPNIIYWRFEEDLGAF